MAFSRVFAIFWPRFGDFRHFWRFPTIFNYFEHFLTDFDRFDHFFAYFQLLYADFHQFRAIFSCLLAKIRPKIVILVIFFYVFLHFLCFLLIFCHFYDREHVEMHRVMCFLPISTSFWCVKTVKIGQEMVKLALFT